MGNNGQNDNSWHSHAKNTDNSSGNNDNTISGLQGNNKNAPAAGQNTPPRTGGLLSNYAGQQKINPSSSPVSLPAGNPPSTPGAFQVGNPPSSSGSPQIRRTGGLFLPQQFSQNLQNNGASSFSAQQRQFGENQQQLQPYQQPQPVHQGVVASTLNMMRSWSGKVAALAGYRAEPPAPYMERYHTPQMPPAMKGTPTLPAATRRHRWKRSRTLRIAMQMRQRRQRWMQTRPAAKNIWTSLPIAVLLLLIVTIGSGSAYAYSLYANELPHVQEIAQKYISQTTRIYDRNMKPIYDVYSTKTDASGGSGRRTVVSFDQIPQVMRDAMVAAEDRTFWTNSGIDPQGISRALVGFISHSGSIQGGGSTITQQVVKNVTGNAEQTSTRKLTEAALAIGLTQQYTKAKILEMYFNVAPFGSQDLGIESATEEYFNLQPHCAEDFKCTPGITQLDINLENGQHDPILALARASLLAGMPQKPSSNDPTQGDTARQGALDRQVYVLKQMISDNMLLEGKPITEAMAKQAEDLSAKMTFEAYRRPLRARHFVDWVVEQVETALGNGDANAGAYAFITGGFNIKTTVDADLEDYVEKAVDRHLNKPDQQFFPHRIATLSKDNELHDSAVVVINSHTGEVLAMNGSSDYNSTDPRINGAYNVAAPPNGDLGRPVGSTFKPIVYATAFQMGWYPGMIVPDTKSYMPVSGAPAGTPKTDDKRLYIPPDYGAPDTNNRPDTTIRFSTVNSFNVPAVKAMEYAGVQNVATMAKRLGITTLDKQQFTLASALGPNSVPVLQMTGAYQVFANGGQRVPPQGILDVWDNYGHDLYHYDPNNPTKIQVLSPEVSYLMTSVLIDEPSRGFEFADDHVLSFADLDDTCRTTPLGECRYQVAAKTGTTDSFKDNWTIGYTPNVVVGVWSGNANNDPMVSSAQGGGITGVTGAAPIWHDVIKTASGYCQPGSDEYLPCPDPGIDPKALGLTQDKVFTKPAKIRTVCTSTVNGLQTQSGGNCDYVIAGQEPQQAGFVQNPPTPNNGGNRNNNSNPGQPH